MISLWSRKNSVYVDRSSSFIETIKASKILNVRNIFVRFIYYKGIFISQCDKNRNIKMYRCTFFSASNCIFVKLPEISETPRRPVHKLSRNLPQCRGTPVLHAATCFPRQKKITPTRIVKLRDDVRHLVDRFVESVVGGCYLSAYRRQLFAFTRDNATLSQMPRA